MTDKQNLVLKGLLSLTASERTEVIREANGFETKTFSEKSNINESLKKSLNRLGPISGNTCPVCGK